MWICIMMLLLGLCLGHSPVNAEESGMYVEKRILEVSEGFTKMFPLQNGGYALYRENQPLYLYKSDGSVEVQEDEWREDVKIQWEENCAVSFTGEMFLVVYPELDEDEFKDAVDTEMLVKRQYLYIDAMGNCENIILSGECFDSFELLECVEFSEQGDLYACTSEGNVFLIDVKSGEMEFLFQVSENIEEICFINQIMLVTGKDRVWLYDLEKGMLQEENQILNHFIQSHGEIEIDENENILYLACRNGIYQYVWDGSVMEQITDAAGLSLEDVSVKLQSIEYISDGYFRILYSPGGLTEVYFDEFSEKKTENTLIIYSLNEDERIRYASQLFEKEHPEVSVKYITGMSGDNAMEKEDALKKLNTDILTGNGPDILILDGMDIERYAEKGVLKNLDGFLERYLEEQLLFENIIDGMRMTDEEKIYALPLTVKLPVWLSDRNYLQGENSLEDIVKGMELARVEHPEGGLLAVRNEQDLLRQLAMASAPSWIDEEGYFAEECVKEFYEMTEKLWNLHIQGLNENEWEQFLEKNRENQSWSEDGILNVALGAFGEEENKQIWLHLGYLDTTFHRGLGALHVYKNVLDKGYFDKDGDIGWDLFQGQVQNVFYGQTIVGITANTECEKLTEEFLKLLLSDELMNKWWLNQGIPVLKEAVIHSLDIANRDYAEYANWNDVIKSIYYSSEYWADEEEIQWFLNSMETVNVFYQPGMMVEDIVLEIGEKVCTGELSPEEGVREAARRCAIELEE